MTTQKKPYLILPLLIEQPTWGGTYICDMKGWLKKQSLTGKIIGQSYELYSESRLATTITSTDSEHFGPDVIETLPISIFTESRPFPLIKFTQARGNSFQLHINPEQKDDHWKPKAESWYYFEDGKITFGVKRGIEVGRYKESCKQIETKMKELRDLVSQKKLNIHSATEQARTFILEQNPWQYVNVHEVKKGDIVDLSGGGLHHSWEEDAQKYPLGNIVYEVQQDVMDPDCTLRSFDQGKMKDDGTIREIHIEKYFEYLDTDEKRNTLKTQKSEEGVLFDTPYYSLSLLQLDKEREMKSSTSFHHLFVKEGKITVKDRLGNEVVVGRGHACFIPQDVEYSVIPIKESEVLLTFLRA